MERVWYIPVLNNVFQMIFCAGLGFLAAYFAKYDFLKKVKGSYVKAREKYYKNAMSGIDKKHAYEQVDSMLLKRGIKFRMGENFGPFDYLMLRLVLGLAIGVFTMAIYPYLLVPGAIGGFYLVGWYFKHKDSYDNGEMIPDISQMYGIVSLQLKNDIFLADVIYECALNVEYPRLKKALNELSMEIKQFSDIKSATDHFRKKFENDHIDMFSKTLEQAQDTGSAVELFQDIESQIKGINEALAMKQERKIDDICGVFQILVFLSAILFVAYIMMNMLSQTSI